MQENTCRGCKYFMYHRFAGFCSKNYRDTRSFYGECEACDKFEKASDEEYQKLVEYEKKVFKF